MVGLNLCSLALGYHLLVGVDDAGYLDVVDLGPELDTLVLLSPHYRTDIWSVDADDVVFTSFRSKWSLC